MNRRGFISMLAGSAGAALVPWRMDVGRIITLGERDVLVAVTGLEVTQHPILRDLLVDRRAYRVTNERFEQVLTSVNHDCAFIYRSDYRRFLMQIGPWHDYRFKTGTAQYYADMRADARAALADDLLHDWSKDQPQIAGIWS
jgi:hypothetical protein